MSKNITILIVDDEPRVVNSLKRVLNNNEYYLYTATDSSQALEIINNYKIDIIICDYRMPNIKGIDILKYSKGILPDAIRILITGYPDLNTTISAINEVGIYYYISKPWVNEEVVSIIERAAQEKRIQKKKEELFDILNIKTNYTRQSYRKKFPVMDNEDIILLDNSEIYYLTAMDGNVFIVTEKGKFLSNYSLNAWGKKLDCNFFRSHRSYIVNIDKIDKISPWFNGAYNLKLKKVNESIPVSRGYMKKLKEIFEL